MAKDFPTRAAHYLRSLQSIFRRDHLGGELDASASAAAICRQAYLLFKPPRDFQETDPCHRAELSMLAADLMPQKSGVAKYSALGVELPILYFNDWLRGPLIPLEGIRLAHHISARKPTLLPSIAKPSHPEIYAQAFPERELFDRPAFRLVNVSPDASALTLAPGSYYRFFNACEYLGFELRSVLYEKLNHGQPIRPAELLSRCRWRTAVVAEMRRGPRQFLKSIHAGVGLNVLTVLVCKGAAKEFIVHIRGFKTVEAAGTIHVVPAGTVQPARKNPLIHTRGRECSLVHVALREFGEEVIGHEELEMPDNAVGNLADLFSGHPKLELLVLMLKTRMIRFYWLGLGLDALTLKPEALALAIVDYEFMETIRKKFKWNWEGTGEHRELTAPKDFLDYAKAHNSLPAGAACALRASELYGDIMEQIDRLYYERALLR